MEQHQKLTVVITGASSGSVYAAALSKGMACGDGLSGFSGGKAASSVGMPQDSYYTIMHIDLASLESVRQF